MVFKDATFHGEKPEIENEYPHHAQLEENVASALASAGGLDAVEINVIAKNSNIVLRGFVGSAEEIDRAITVAKSVEGVQTVQADIHIRI